MGFGDQSKRQQKNNEKRGEAPLFGKKGSANPKDKRLSASDAKDQAHNMKRVDTTKAQAAARARRKYKD